MQVCSRVEGKPRPGPLISRCYAASESESAPAASLFVDLDGVLCDFDRGVQNVTGRLPDHQVGFFLLFMSSVSGRKIR